MVTVDEINIVHKLTVFFLHSGQAFFFWSLPQALTDPSLQNPHDHSLCRAQQERLTKVGGVGVLTAQVALPWLNAWQESL